MKFFLFSFLVFVISCFSLHASKGEAPLVLCATIDTSQKPQDVSALLESIIAKPQIPGIAAIVIHNGRIQMSGAAGVRAYKHSEKITINDLFHIGSDAKAMTATLAAILVEKGLISWNSKVTDVFPELSEKINPAYRLLTLEQLLTHRGGLSANFDYVKIEAGCKNDMMQGRHYAIKQILSEPPATIPGNYLYSNNGYVIAGHMEEKVAGKPWEQLIQDELFTPLKMFSVGIGPPGSRMLIDQPRGHNENGEPLLPGPDADNSLLMSPSGTLHMSLTDWAKFINLHLKAAQGCPVLLKLNSFQKLQTPIDNPPPAYAMGWIVEHQDWAKGKVLTHSGSNQLWYAKVWMAPSQDLAILVALNSNGDKAAKAANEAGLALLKMELHQPDIKAIDNSKTK